MNLEEQIEKAFVAGAGYVSEHTWVDEGNDYADTPTDNEINTACMDYINGNSESNKN
jgi:hypothetical protein